MSAEQKKHITEFALATITGFSDNCRSRPSALIREAASTAADGLLIQLRAAENFTIRLWPGNCRVNDT